MITELIGLLGPAMKPLQAKVTEAMSKWMETRDPVDLTVMQQYLNQYNETITLLSTMLKTSHDTTISIIQKI